MLHERKREKAKERKEKLDGLLDATRNVITHVNLVVAVVAFGGHLAILATLIETFRLNHQVMWIDASCVSAQMTHILINLGQSSKMNKSRKNVQADLYLSALVLQRCLSVAICLCRLQASQQARASLVSLCAVDTESLAELLRILDAEQLRSAGRHCSLSLSLSGRKW